MSLHNRIPLPALTLLFLVVASIAGCGPSPNPPKIYAPLPEAERLGSPLLTYRVERTLVDFGASFERAKPVGSNGIYLVQYKGGNIFLGLLGAATGAIGAGLTNEINRGLIEKKSKKIAEGFESDEHATIAKLVERKFESLDLLSNEGVPIQPNLLILIGKDDKVRVSLVFSVEAGDDIERFFYEFRYIATKTILENRNQQQFFDKIFAELPVAIETLGKALPGIHTNEYGDGRKTAIESDFFAPFEGLPFEAYILSHQGDRTILRVNAKNAFMTIHSAHGSHLMFDAHYKEVK